MNRLQKKCFAGSAGLHVLVIASSILGAAFWKPEPKEESFPLLDIIPTMTTDDPFAGGGKPDAPPPNVRPDAPVVPAASPAQTAAKAPEVSTPPPPVEPPVQSKPPEPVPEKVVVEDRVDPESVLPAPKKPKRPVAKETEETQPKKAATKKEIKVNLEVAKRYPADIKADREKKRREEEARAASEAVERAAAERLAGIRGAVSALSGKLSKGTSVEIPGTGGEAYANYNSVVRTVYDRAWIDPGDGVDESLSVTVTVTLRRDGQVLKAQTFITRNSGNDALDRSVQRALDRVTFVAPFPEGAKDAQRTFRIRFNLRDKRMNG